MLKYRFRNATFWNFHPNPSDTLDRVFFYLGHGNMQSAYFYHLLYDWYFWQENCHELPDFLFCVCQVFIFDWYINNIWIDKNCYISYFGLARFLYLIIAWYIWQKKWHRLLDFLFCICQVLIFIFHWYIWQMLRKIAWFHILR